METPIVENAVQDAYLRALERWPREGPPNEPERWLVRVAHNVMVDALRREPAVAALDAVHDAPVDGDPPALDGDNELRLILLCCDRRLTRAAQLALVLNVAFGLSARQIASAFLSDERTVAQRIVRAKQRLRDEGVRFALPDGAALPAQLAAVLDVLYLVFSEGFNPTGADTALDVGLCNEALRLVRLLTETEHTVTPAAFALRALLCFHASRAPARLADDGSLLLMPEQDRARWDGRLMAEAFQSLNPAGAGQELTRFRLEAAIAACHALGSTYATTDWARIVELYDLLRERAVAGGRRQLSAGDLDAGGAQAGLDELDAIPEREVLGRYPYALAAFADLHASLGNLEEARSYLDRALAHQAAPAQQALLRRKRAALERQRTRSWGQAFVPGADIPVAGDAVEHERVVARELLGGVAAGEARHRALVPWVREGAGHQQRAARVELLAARAVGREVDRRRLHNVGGGIVEQDVLHVEPRLVSGWDRSSSVRARPSLRHAAVCAWRRYTPGGTPKCRLNALLKAISES
jgi:RNA polymerase sigma-70 factor (ECF subfamily)